MKRSLRVNESAPSKRQKTSTRPATDGAIDGAEMVEGVNMEGTVATSVPHMGEFSNTMPEAQSVVSVPNGAEMEGNLNEEKDADGKTKEDRWYWTEERKYVCLTMYQEALKQAAETGNRLNKMDTWENITKKLSEKYRCHMGKQTAQKWYKSAIRRHQNGEKPLAYSVTMRGGESPLSKVFSECVGLEQQIMRRRTGNREPIVLKESIGSIPIDNIEALSTASAVKPMSDTPQDGSQLLLGMANEQNLTSQEYVRVMQERTKQMEMELRERELSAMESRLARDHELREKQFHLAMEERRAEAQRRDAEWAQQMDVTRRLMDVQIEQSTQLVRQVTDLVQCVKQLAQQSSSE